MRLLFLFALSCFPYFAKAELVRVDSLPVTYFFEPPLATNPQLQRILSEAADLARESLRSFKPSEIPEPELMVEPGAIESLEIVFATAKSAVLKGIRGGGTEVREGIQSFTFPLVSAEKRRLVVYVITERVYLDEEMITREDGFARLVAVFGSQLFGPVALWARSSPDDVTAATQKAALQKGKAVGQEIETWLTGKACPDELREDAVAQRVRDHIRAQLGKLRLIKSNGRG